jgi:hypothetical protein
MPRESELISNVLKNWEMHIQCRDKPGRPPISTTYPESKGTANMHDIAIQSNRGNFWI